LIELGDRVDKVDLSMIGGAWRDQRRKMLLGVIWRNWGLLGVTRGGKCY